MAVKWSTPGIRQQEIDNTIVQANADPGIGIGAIVFKSNKGPVNQRVLARNYSEFTDIFGEPETLTDYGHFAAENYLAISNQLLGVRCTMGDEEYAQIQFAYPDASVTATNESKDTSVFKFVDNIGNNNLQLLQKLQEVTVIKPLIEAASPNETPEWKMDEDETSACYALHQSAKWATLSDIMNNNTDTIVYKDGEVIKGTGKHVIYPTNVDIAANLLGTDDKLIFTEDAFESGSASPEVISISKNIINNSDPKTKYYENSGCKVTINIPAKDTLNYASYKVSFLGEYSAVSGWKENGVEYDQIFKSENFYPAGVFSALDEEHSVSAGLGKADAQKLQLLDWDDTSVKKTYYVDEDGVLASGTCSAINFREYGQAIDTYAIIGGHNWDDDPADETYYCNSCSAMFMNGTDIIEYLDNRSPKKVIFDIADDYGVSDVSELMNSYYLAYYDVQKEQVVEKVIKEDINKKNSEGKIAHIQTELFWMYADKSKENSTIVSVYEATAPDLAKLPIQDDYIVVHTEMLDSGEEVTTNITRNPIVATPTSYLFNSADKTYEDGYTILTQTEDEPGNGDIENYASYFDNQLVIASIGPGKYGNDIGVSIITAECSKVAALQHQNAFNWKYNYDDEDLIDNDPEDYSENTLDLTWKKVFRINVYLKPKTQTAKAAWGSGMDALLKDPVESWLVSTDPYAKDAEGNSLYAPTKINGHSEYIYVSRASAAAAMNAKGKYEQPYQTYSIYQLTGGKNSTKNNIIEKTAALELYKDRRKAEFDILFNCDAVEQFGVMHYIRHQKKIAEIAARRTMDIGVVQVTSKAAKTCKAMIGEAKMFTFNNGTYVAEYGGYDKYYNGTLASWIYLPKSVAGACAMAYCDMYAYPWMAPAGTARGSIQYSAGVLKRLTDDEIGQLYDQQVNTSRESGGYGELLWGQKTALKKISALNRINVRRCLNYIEKNLENMLTPYLFQQNTANTRASAKNVIDSFLQRVQSNEGIISFSTSVTQDPDDAHVMNVNIHVVPAETIEFIDIKINIDRNSGVNVEEG